jgi:hypothetical protein
MGSDLDTDQDDDNLETPSIASCAVPLHRRSTVYSNTAV